MPVIEKPGSTQPGTPPAGFDLVRPPFTLVVAQVGLLAFAVAAFFVEGIWFEAFTVLLTVFGSVLTFGLMRMVDDLRRSNLSYTDWSFMSARRFSLLIMLVTWTIGMVHVFRAAREITRIYNL